MYGCKSCTVTKAECQRIDVFELWCWRRLLRVLWNARRSNQSILKEINHLYSLRTDAEALILWPNLMGWANSLKKTLMLGKVEGRRRRGQKRTRWLNGISDLMDMTLRKLWDLVEDREAWRAASMGLQRVRHDWVTQQQHSLEPSPTSWPVHMLSPSLREDFLKLPHLVICYSTYWCYSFTLNQLIIQLTFISPTALSLLWGHSLFSIIITIYS